jgi:2,5-diketo-D-gluconate reductase A
VAVAVSVKPMTVPTLTLNNGVQIPQFGYGTWQVPPESVQDRVTEALDVGYRHIDTAQMYGNEEGVGAAIASAGLPRDEVFVTTKLNNNRHDPAVVAGAVDESLEKLGLDRVDLLLIHWPLPMIDIDFVDTWRALEEVYAAGKARAIGVSNFQASHLRRVVQEATVVPAVNQIEVHPYFTQDELRAVNTDLGVATQAWSPLAQGQVFDDAALGAIAHSTGRSVSQVVLRWHLQRGDVVFPKASSVELSAADMGAISALDAGRRIGPDPDEMSWVPKG